MKKETTDFLSNSRADRPLDRRRFLRRTTALAAGVVAFPYIVPASAFGAAARPAPGNRFTMGCIGTGSQGTGNMTGFLGMPELQVVAVCDVDREHRLNAKRIVDERYRNTDCAEYNDFRELLARDDLDCVSIAVPDHWHAIPAIAAARRGLDIYAEKPLALTIPQGRAMVDAVHRYGIVWQTGSWQRSQSHFRHACELVRNGRIGEVHTVEVGLPTGPSCEPQPEMPVPDGFDYDFWLGPAPHAPYTEKRCHWNFRWILDYSGGQLTDWAAHHCDIANWGMGTEYTGPVEVEGRGEYPRDGLYDAATNYKFACKYPPGASPVAPNGFTMMVSNSYPGGAKFIGSDGWVHVDRGHLTTEPAALKDSVIGPNEIHLYASDNHARNFLECMQTRRETITPIEVAHRAIAIAHLGNIAMRLERRVRWDPRNEAVLDDPETARMLDRAMRAPWHL
ncbi:MAG TPA: Gfo/Idh/MocA family oxidoreductase [Candidatus Hydrogenedentes bacterium]|nr:Gfo/Idh/MocA family oxidoreductase [Candidatus Hydrogenedentota bacterium]HNT86591.1 Gfo/Idh/MocA family oxidoreductase [Candidatus Hydrogenedentota bacterium]